MPTRRREQPDVDGSCAASSTGRGSRSVRRPTSPAVHDRGTATDRRGRRGCDGARGARSRRARSPHRGCGPRHRRRRGRVRRPPSRSSTRRGRIRHRARRPIVRPNTSAQSSVGPSTSRPHRRIHSSNSAWRFGDNDRRRTLNDAAGRRTERALSPPVRTTSPDATGARLRLVNDLDEAALKRAIHRQAASIVAAVAPFGIVFGAAAATAGLSLVQAMGFSLVRLRWQLTVRGGRDPRRRRLGRVGRDRRIVAQRPVARVRCDHGPGAGRDVVATRGDVAVDDRRVDRRRRRPARAALAALRVPRRRHRRVSSCGTSRRPSATWHSPAPGI